MASPTGPRPQPRTTPIQIFAARAQAMTVSENVGRSRAARTGHSSTPSWTSPGHRANILGGYSHATVGCTVRRRRPGLDHDELLGLSRSVHQRRWTAARHLGLERDPGQRSGRRVRPGQHDVRARCRSAPTGRARLGMVGHDVPPVGHGDVLLGQSGHGLGAGPVEDPDRHRLTAVDGTCLRGPTWRAGSPAPGRSSADRRRLLTVAGTARRTPGRRSANRCRRTTRP